MNMEEIVTEFRVDNAEHSLRQEIMLEFAFSVIKDILSHMFPGNTDFKSIKSAALLNQTIKNISSNELTQIPWNVSLKQTTSASSPLSATRWTTVGKIVSETLARVRKFPLLDWGKRSSSRLLI